MIPGQRIDLPTSPGAPEQVHVLAEDEIRAVETALAARRALLVRGEPGTGKTQLALAAAKVLGRGFVSWVVDARTESRDLLWHFDAVARLAKAQLRGALGVEYGDRAAIEAELDIRNFIHPRPLWWALNWNSASRQASIAHAPAPTQPQGFTPANGLVVLIDEIDKADSEVPNGLLEALGTGEFTPQGFDAPVRAGDTTPPPLVIITTNEERVLPDAFIRRCLALHLRLPTDPAALKALLIERGRAHFPGMPADVLAAAAEMLARDRATARRGGWLPPPGQAEFMDLLRAVHHRAPSDPVAQKADLETIRPFVLRKHPDAVWSDTAPTEATG